MGNKEIKPCPFCGGPAFSYTIHPALPFPQTDNPGYVECASAACRAVLQAASEEKAIELWNRRADDGT